MLFAYGDVAAQWTQQKACPGWNNPSNFTGWTNQTYGAGGYSGSGGVKNQDACPNVMTGATGTQSLGPDYAASQLNTVTAPGCSNASGAIPNQQRQFAIMTDINGTDVNTGNRLKYIPTQFNNIDTAGTSTQFTKSIRIGDGCANGGVYGVSLLNYDMKVTSQNAMLYLYYAIVAEAPGHGTDGDPTFIIRLMKKAANNTWTRLSDTLAYYISSTPSGGYGGNPCNLDIVDPIADYSVNGWHSVGGVYYKDWSKVAINLGNYIYDTIRVQVLIYDCVAEFHYAYAYIAGECRPMELKTTGCPPGMSTDVTTISAPRGMMRYEWGASEYGVSDPVANLNPGKPNDYFTFNRLRMSQDIPHVGGDYAEGPEDSVFRVGNRYDTVHYYDYHVQASDFSVRYRPNANKTQGIPASPDSVGNRQTFRCQMTSALDPSKPFKTSLYISVQNTKPSMIIDTLSLCDGSVRLWNQSKVPGAPTAVDLSATTWKFYSNEQAFGVPDTTINGDSANYDAPNTNLHWVLVRTINGNTPTCYSEGIYPIRALETPNTGMTISNRVLCDSATTILTDTTAGVQRRMWRFLKPEYDGPLTGLDYDNMAGMLDSVEGLLDDKVTVERPFNHSIEPIELIVWNGLSYVDRASGQRLPCYSVARDTVAVFVHPELKITGDTIVCEGSLTDAVVRTVGVDGCSYQWSMTDGYVSGGLPAGDTLRVVPYADTSIYFIQVTSPQGCVAWGSAFAYHVRPRLAMFPPHGMICPGDSVLLVGSMADHYSWKVGASTVGSGDTIWVTPNATTEYTMIGHGSNDCDAKPLTTTVTVVPYPVPTVSLSPKYVDADDPTVVLTDVSPNSASTSWLFFGGEVADGKAVKHTFEEAYSGQDSVVYVVRTSANALGCTIVDTIAIPVHLFTAWLPTAFTPGSEDQNARFRLFTINEYEYFHIYVYNREGMLVFESEDPAFEWDGTHDGTACPQGAYVYVCNYRKPNVGTLSTRKGTITLLR